MLSFYHYKLKKFNKYSFIIRNRKAFKEFLLSFIYKMFFFNWFSYLLNFQYRASCMEIKVIIKHLQLSLQPPLLSVAISTPINLIRTQWKIYYLRLTCKPEKRWTVHLTENWSVKWINARKRWLILNFIFLVWPLSSFALYFLCIADSNFFLTNWFLFDVFLHWAWWN